MFRQIPSVSKICSKRIHEQELQRMEQRVKKVQAQVDTSQPQTFDLAHQSKKPRNQMQESQITEIERENRILLEKITKVMSKDPGNLKTPSHANNINNQGIKEGNGSNMQQASQMQSHQSQMYPQKRSLNSGVRKRDLVKITLENQHLLQRLQNKRSDYEQKKQVKDWIESQERVSRISEFGKRPSTKCSMDSRSLPRATLEYTESEENTATTNTPNKKETQFSKRDSLKALPASAHLLKREKLWGKNGGNETEMGAPQMIIKKRVGSGYLGKEGRIQRMKNNSSAAIIEAGKKHILFKKSKKIGLTLYLLELSVENGILRIIADDAENPRRKVLEMSELDGMKILERYYGNSPETMLESVHVTEERITLKGLEKGSFEQYKKSNSSDKIGQISKQENETPRGFYGRALPNNSQILEEPDQESVDMSTSNVDNKIKIQSKQIQQFQKLKNENESKIKGNNENVIGKIESTQKQQTYQGSTENTTKHDESESVPELLKQSQTKEQHEDEGQLSKSGGSDGFDEYSEDYYDDNESEKIKQIKNQQGELESEREGREEDIEQNLSYSQNISQDLDP